MMTREDYAALCLKYHPDYDQEMLDRCYEVYAAEQARIIAGWTKMQERLIELEPDLRGI